MYICLLPGFGIFNFILYQKIYFIPQGKRREDKVIVIVLFIIDIKEVKRFMNFIGYFKFGCQEQAVSVDSGGILIEVTRSYCCIALCDISLHTCNEQQFRMHLKPRNSVNNLYSFIHQLVSPQYVCLLIEPCLQFNYSGHAFAVPCSIDRKSV